MSRAVLLLLSLSVLPAAGFAQSDLSPGDYFIDSDGEVLACKRVNEGWDAYTGGYRYYYRNRQGYRAHRRRGRGEVSRVWDFERILRDLGSCSDTTSACAAEFFRIAYHEEGVFIQFLAEDRLRQCPEEPETEHEQHTDEQSEVTEDAEGPRPPVVLSSAQIECARDLQRIAEFERARDRWLARYRHVSANRCRRSSATPSLSRDAARLATHRSRRGQRPPRREPPRWHAEDLNRAIRAYAADPNERNQARIDALTADLANMHPVGFGAHPLVTTAKKCLPDIASKLIDSGRLPVTVNTADAASRFIDLELESSSRRFLAAYRDRMQRMTKAERLREPFRLADWEPELRARCELTRERIRSAAAPH